MSKSSDFKKNARRSRKIGFKESAKATAQKLLRMQLRLAAVEHVNSLPKSMKMLCCFARFTQWNILISWCIRSPAKSLTGNLLRKDQDSSPNQKRKRDDFELPADEKTYGIRSRFVISRRKLTRLQSDQTSRPLTPVSLLTKSSATLSTTIATPST
jgi:hypothetical protein